MHLNFDFFQVLILCLQKSPKKSYGKCSLIKFFGNLLHNLTGAFWVWVKVLSNDFSKELDQNSSILVKKPFNLPQKIPRWIHCVAFTYVATTYNSYKYIACVTSVSVQLRCKERGTSVKNRVKNGASKRAGRGGEERYLSARSISHTAKTENSVPRSFFAPKPNGNACYAGLQIQYCLTLFNNLFIFHF